LPRLLLACAALACGAPPEIDFSGPTAEWRHYAGDPGGLRYSPLTQITAANVDRLELVWEHRSGDFHAGSKEHAGTAFQVNPLVVGDSLYYCTPFQRVFALDAESGEERWAFDPVLRSRATGGPYPLGCRGLAYWEDASAAPDRACSRRLLYGTRDSELIALDAHIGEPCRDFGREGRVALREGLEPGIPDWEYYPTSPPVIVGDIAVLGALVADQLRTDNPSGVVRAFDVRSGALVWAWDPVPPGGGARAHRPGERWARGTPNVWSILSADPERGLVFVPTGNPGPDSYGGERHGVDFYGSSTVALDARTGRVVWHFQAVHHDVWDFDTPAQPQLFQIPGVGRGRPGVAQPTKMGFLFLLDRETGAPLYPVEERPVPQGAAPGESLSPTQPFPTHPAPLHPERIEPWGFTPWDRRACEELLGRYRWDGFYTPPSLEGSLQTPHTSGGMNWGGVAIDPLNAIAITNQNHLVLVTRFVPREEFEKLDPAAVIYPQEAYPMKGTPYGLSRFTALSPFGAPCNKPPWGTLAAVDLRSGKVLWNRPFGTTRDSAPFPIWLELGVPNFGGGILTAGGVFLIGATWDRYFRAFDPRTGEELWRRRIPYAANSLPATYRLRKDGRQFVVVAAGGNPLTGPGDALLAFALRE
jgi:quinoprotein glucose dehydrogenase